jgi:hypothetical protein
VGCLELVAHEIEQNVFNKFKVPWYMEGSEMMVLEGIDFDNFGIILLVS